MLACSVAGSSSVAAGSEWPVESSERCGPGSVATDSAVAGELPVVSEPLTVAELVAADLAAALFESWGSAELIWGALVSG